MRLLLLHAKEFAYKALSKAMEAAEELDENNNKGSFSNALVVFTTIELDDEKNAQAVVEQAVEEIIDVYAKVKADIIVVYPYAHLSSQLATPSKAMEILALLYNTIKRKGVKVHKAPFGWYKEFTLHCYGHPLSELSKHITITRTQQKKTIEKKYYILTPEGKLYKPSEYEFNENVAELKILVDKEVFGKEIESGQGRVGAYLRKFGFEWEEISDRGHMRYQPHATVMLEAVADYAWLVASSLDVPVFRIRGTNMFSLRAEPVKQHAELFGERMYEIRSDSEVFILRFAACYQQFSILKDWSLSYRDLPLGMFEVADSYRYEQRGELVLGFRLRRFHMPDLHILTKDIEEAKQIVYRVRDKIIEEAKKLGREYQAIYNVTEDFLNSNFDYIVDLVKKEGKPVLLVVYPAGLYYWVINVEYIIIDELKRPREIATWQIDVGNAKRFGICYADERGEKHYPVIIHTAIIGSIERYLYMIFDTIAQNETKGIPPTLPTWLSPIQVRVIPVKKDHISYALKIAKTLSNYGIRVDVDDRDESLGRRIRDAGVEWIPYVVVIGDREVSTNTLNVRMRKDGVQKAMTLDELVRIITEELKGYPLTPSALPLLMSKRPALYYLRPIQENE
uniref:Threonine--tRNA ligase n=1 Tax=Ignisphaera aggregans TaxID=334771 RepID=A0A7C2VG47_9CREN